MAVATRSVASTFLLISVLVYGFGIVFRTQLGTEMPEYFSDIWKSMRTLIHNGVFMDNVAGLGVEICEQDVSLWMLYMTCAERYL